MVPGRGRLLLLLYVFLLSAFLCAHDSVTSGARFVEKSYVEKQKNNNNNNSS